MIRNPRPQRASTTAHRQPSRPSLEILEDRLAPATLDYLAAQTYASGGSAAVSVAVGDFNNDDNADLVVANYLGANVTADNQAGNVSVQTGDGSGNFAAAVTYSGPSYYPYPYSVAVADFNHDDNDDLAVAKSGSGIDVFLGNGSGFAPAVDFNSGGTIPLAVAVGDFNDDGHADLAVTNYLSSNVGVLLGDGNGGFGSVSTYATGGAYPYSVAVGDFNHDGYDDLAVPNSDSTNVGVLLGNGGGFAPALSFASGGLRPVSVAVADFNDDDNADLAVTNQDSATVGVLLGNGSGGFAPPVTFASGDAQPYSVAVGDFNDDGNADLAVTTLVSSTVGVLLGDSGGGFAPALSFASGGAQPYSVAVGDFNKDGKDDLALAHLSGQVGVLLNATVTNQPPTNTVPGAQIVIEDIAEVVGGLSVADDAAGVLTVTLTAAHGTLTINASVAGGLTASDISGNGTASVTLTGTQVRINSTLAAANGLIYLGVQDYHGSDTLTMTTTDAGMLSDSDTVAIQVLSPPVNTVPGVQQTAEDVPLVFASAHGNAISVSDADAGGQILEVTLFVTNGTLTLGATAGLTFSTGDGTTDATMTFTGTLLQINSALNGLSFVPTQNFSGAANLFIATNDLGASAALIDHDWLTIAVLSAADQAGNVTQAVNDLIATGTFSSGQGGALTSKLATALQKIQQGNINAAVNLLNAFISQVQSFVADGILSVAQGNALMAAANNIISSIQT